MKKPYIPILAALLLLCIAPCAFAVVAQSNEIVIAVGQTVAMYPSDSPVTWVSADDTVATVSDIGEIAGKKPGFTAVWMESGGEEDYISVRVVPPGEAVTELLLSTNKLTLIEGSSKKLSVKVLPLSALFRTGTWTSDDPSVAQVSPSGVVTGVSKGVAHIWATASSGIRVSCEVAVKEVPVAQVVISKKAAAVKLGDSLQLSAICKPVTAPDNTLSWFSKQDSIADVDPSSGLVTTKAPGKAVIVSKSNTYPDVYAQCVVTVQPIKVQSFKVSPVSMTVKIGASLPLATSILPENATNQTIVWKSSNLSVATVADGMIYAKAPGTAMITGTCGGIKSTCKITVQAP